ncbi:MAG: DUF3450 family protein, partial [Planctomycetota bacterium]
MATAIVLVFAPGLLVGEDESHRLAAAIRTRIEEIQAVRQARQREAESHRDAQGLVEGQTARLQTEIESARGEAGAGDRAVHALRKRMEEGEAAVAEHRAILEELRAVVEPVAEAFWKRIATGVPHARAARIARFESVAAALRKPDAPQEWADALNEFWDALNEELRLAGTRELVSAAVDLPGGRRKHAYRLRLGLVNEFYRTEDGESVGLASFGEDAWRELDAGPMRQVVAEAIDVLRQHRLPELQRLPFTCR